MAAHLVELGILPLSVVGALRNLEGWNGTHSSSGNIAGEWNITSKRRREAARGVGGGVKSRVRKRHRHYKEGVHLKRDLLQYTVKQFDDIWSL